MNGSASTPQSEAHQIHSELSSIMNKKKWHFFSISDLKHFVGPQISLPIKTCLLYFTGLTGIRVIFVWLFMPSTKHMKIISMATTDSYWYSALTRHHKTQPRVSHQQPYFVCHNQLIWFHKRKLKTREVKELIHGPLGGKSLSIWILTIVLHFIPWYIEDLFL